jgi:hypothetical protein
LPMVKLGFEISVPVAGNRNPPSISWRNLTLTDGSNPAFFISNHLRGVAKTFGRIVAKGGGRISKTNFRTPRTGWEALAAIASPLLATCA